MNTRHAVSGVLVSALFLASCASPPADTTAPVAAAPARFHAPGTVRGSGHGLPPRIEALLPADALLLGEQHDAAAHQQLQLEVVLGLAVRRQLAALALEMGDRGTSTAGLARDASEDQVKAALQWDNAGWPWPTYGPVVMAAVRSGVPVLGANLPRGQMRNAMNNVALDDRLTRTALEIQQKNIREGHCGMLPESQIAPMTRIQIARDVSMAETVAAARQPGKTVLLVAGGGHVLRDRGVPVHLPPTLTTSVLLAQATSDGGGAAASDAGGAADLIWPTPAITPKDYCAEMRKSMQRKG
jgi:uncharacterized iron-regulated protein